MAKLAFLGHKTRSKEIIELLKLFGAQHGIYGIGHYPTYPHMIYYINEYNLIEACDRMHHLEYAQYSLEEFLENFPYKVGDKVLINDDENDAYTVKSMEWSEDFNRVVYRIEAVDGIMDDHTWFAHEMHAAVSFNTKKEETMEEKKINQMSLANCDLDEVEIILGDKFELKIKEGKYYAIKKKPQYPKTYDECCSVLVGREPKAHEISFSKMSLQLVDDNHTNNIAFDAPMINEINILYRLIMCRNAYWKIADDWKFDFDEKCYYICIRYGEIEKFEGVVGCNIVLAFPTAKMRDAFYENFKDLIEQCKEFL